MLCSGSNVGEYNIVSDWIIVIGETITSIPVYVKNNTITTDQSSGIILVL